MGIGVQVGLGVYVGTGVYVGAIVALGLGVQVGAGVQVGPIVPVGINVNVGVGVHVAGLGVCVGSPGTTVGVSVGVVVAVGVNVIVGVEVNVSVGVGEGVCVENGSSVVHITVWTAVGVGAGSTNLLDTTRKRSNRSIIIPAASSTRDAMMTFAHSLRSDIAMRPNRPADPGVEA